MSDQPAEPLLDATVPAPPPQTSITERTVAGTSWVMLWRLATRVLGTFSTLILARLLLPADFGLVALGTVFSQSIDLMSLLGVQEALIREKAPTRAMYDTAFTLSALRGLFTGGIVAAAAIPASAFFGDPRVIPVLLVLAGCSVVGGLENIGVVDFRRAMTFHMEFRLLVIPRILQVAIAIGCAAAGLGYVSLLIAITASRVLRTGVSYALHPYRPRLDLSAWRGLVAFSGWTWIIGLLNTVRDRTDAFLVGRTLGTGAVGMLSLGIEVATLPSTEFMEPLARALYPGFSAAFNAGSEMRSTYLRVVGAVVLITMPAGMGLSLIGDPLIRLGFGDAWADAIPIVHLVGVMVAFRVLTFVNWTLLTALGRLRLVFKITLATVLIRVPLLAWLTYSYGLVGTGIAHLAGSIAEEAISVVAARHVLGVGLPPVLRVTWRPIAASLTMAGFLVAAGIGWTTIPGDPSALAAALFGGSALGAVIYGASLFALWTLSGQPDGPEREALRLMATVRARLIARLPRRPRAAPKPLGTAPAVPPSSRPS